jgi:dTDP-4-dehydrorhamnose reductase
MPRILLFGSDGQVGHELRRSLAALGTITALNRAQVDLCDVSSVRFAIRNARPDMIVNAAAYTAVDQAEKETGPAIAINAVAPAAMAEEAAALGVPLLHYSSDYVYGGDKWGAYVETDETNARSAYARSKLAGDEAILATGAQALILRTSWVYAARGSNFLRTILRLAREKDTLRVVADQVGAPTSARLLADVSAQVLLHIYSRKKRDDGTEPLRGVFHCAAAGETSWHAYARFIVTKARELEAKLPPERIRELGGPLKLWPEYIEAITTAEYPTPAARPLNSRLDCSRLQEAFGVKLPLWQQDVEQVLEELF